MIPKLQKNQVKTWLFYSFLGNIYGLQIFICYVSFVSVR